MNSSSCDHCLRPAFSARVAGELIAQRRPINLIGPAGQGRARLLDDLRRIDDGRVVLWLHADLKAHRYSYAGLIKALWAQSGLSGGSPRKLGGLVDRLAADGRPVCLLLHHFDAILDNPDLDPAFDVAFLDVLNAAKNRGISLLCVTERAHASYLMVTRAGERRVSTLVLEDEFLLELSREEVRVEVGRRVSEIGADNSDLLVDAVSKHRRPVAFLGFVARRITDDDHADHPFPQRIREWQEAFKARQSDFGPARALGLRHRVVTWARALGLHKFPLLGFFKAIARWLAGKGKGG